MADIKFKRSAVQDKVPLITDLELGQLAINTYDGKLFLKKDNGTESVVEVGTNTRAVAASVTSGTLTPNGDTTDVYNAFGLTGEVTLATPSGTPSDGQRLMIRLEDNGSARSVAWTTSSGAYRAVGVTLPTTTSASKITYVGCVYNSTDLFWDVIAVVTQL